MDMVKYEDLLVKAGEGDVDALRDLGKFFWGQEHTSRLSFEWFYRAANKDDPESQYYIGKIYFYGFAQQKKDSEKAGTWLLKAYHNGVMAALVELGLMLEDGYAFVPDALPYKKAEQCFRVAYHQHNVEEAKEHLDRLNVKSRKADVGPLASLIGLGSIKTQIASIQKTVAFEQKRAAAGLKNKPQTHHFAFMGNPGTGKTEVARLIGGIFKKMGILKSGHVVEVDRSGFLGEYRGQTSVKTAEVIEKALDGILFIDEAHTLVADREGDLGEEALNLVMKAMEDHRDRLVVIVAGYEDAMKDLIRSNPGFKSRIKHHFVFPDYTADEMVAIYQKFVADEQYILTEDALDRIKKLMLEAKKLLDSDLGNGRFVRNAFDHTIEKMATRVVNNKLDGKDMLQTIMFTDVPTMREVTS